MTILGVILRTRPQNTDLIAERLRSSHGIDVTITPGDGRLIAVIEGADAASTMCDIAAWPDVLSTALVYEYSGPESPAADSNAIDYRHWRNGTTLPPNPLTEPPPTAAI